MELCCYANFNFLLIDTYSTSTVYVKTAQEASQGRGKLMNSIDLFFFSDVNFFALISSLCAWVEPQEFFAIDLSTQSLSRSGKFRFLAFEDKGKLEQSSENSGKFRWFFAVFGLIQQQCDHLEILLRLTASSYDIIDGFELLPPIVHVFTLLTNFYTWKFIFTWKNKILALSINYFERLNRLE